MPKTLALLALLGCSNSLTPLNDLGEDTGVDPGGPEDTGIGGPLDTDDTADTDLDNTPPVADAGADQSAMVEDIVTLDGTASSDPDGDTITYAWELVVTPSGSGTTLLSEHTPTPKFYADLEGTYTVELTVSDGIETAVDEVEVFADAPDEPPVANAGPDQYVAVGDTAQLNGSASYDPDGGNVAFTWTLVSAPSGSTASLSTTSGTMPRFTADLAGTYTVELVVSDGTFDSDPDTVLVVAESADDGDCLSCSAAVRHEMRRRLSVGDAASGPGLVLLPLLFLFWQRKRS